ncbi:NAD-dependent epimerase [Luteimicrobium album]|uniref:NAD-dependent epimerase n=1 Tax=Luteimicrobium album TaxID=1054550 RepID=A0ABQ6HYT8_9MICO|nr:NAD-dependent epimerase/dehydratase family protein [Luteimicrobium album]GMA23664.1 NAD-dependent epimerase [Luteimicrobium album]
MIGPAYDVAAVDEAMDGVDAVVHCAAMASPTLGTAPELFRANSMSTFVVLESAVRHDVRAAVIASSLSVTGLPWGDVPAPWLPLDERVPLQVRDVYAHSKQVDEATAAYLAAAHEIGVVALRYPLLGVPERELGRDAAAFLTDPGAGARSLWAYLDTRDAATAALLALEHAERLGFERFFLSAPNTLATLPSQELVDRFHAGVPVLRRLRDHEALVDTSWAAELLGFAPEHVFDPFTVVSG